MPNQRLTGIVRFDRFELDLRSGELLADGRKSQLQEQLFRILKLLIERAGNVVTREEIRRTLWPNGTVVEFDNAVNAAIKKLRSILGDSAEEPKYIETLKRRGYRLMVPVHCQDAGSTDSGELTDSSRQPALDSPFLSVHDLA